MVAQGNEQTITEAGFVPTKTVTQPTQKPGLATDFQATINGFKGAILAGSQTPLPTLLCMYILPYLMELL